MAREPTLPPWKRPRPAGARSRKKLSPAQIAAARARAEQAGRRYPNLVDNLWAARLKPEELAALAGKSPPKGRAPLV